MQPDYSEAEQNALKFVLHFVSLETSLKLAIKENQTQIVKLQLAIENNNNTKSLLQSNSQKNPPIFPKSILDVTARIPIESAKLEAMVRLKNAEISRLDVLNRQHEARINELDRLLYDKFNDHLKRLLVPRYCVLAVWEKIKTDPSLCEAYKYKVLTICSAIQEQMELKSAKDRLNKEKKTAEFAKRKAEQDKVIFVTAKDVNKIVEERLKPQKKTVKGSKAADNKTKKSSGGNKSTVNSESISTDSNNKNAPKGNKNPRGSNSRGRGGFRGRGRR